ncbi:MAG: hypothetical protein HOV79_31925 [Hamadaea sp.]|nr:hypothetical protein [Hamadaea sp.]
MVGAAVCGAVLAVTSLVLLRTSGSQGLKVSLVGEGGPVPVVSVLVMAGAVAAVGIAVAGVVRVLLRGRRG